MSHTTQVLYYYARNLAAMQYPYSMQARILMAWKGGTSMYTHTYTSMEGVHFNETPPQHAEEKDSVDITTQCKFRVARVQKDMEN